MWGAICYQTSYAWSAACKFKQRAGSQLQLAKHIASCFASKALCCSASKWNSYPCSLLPEAVTRLPIMLLKLLNQYCSKPAQLMGMDTSPLPPY